MNNYKRFTAPIFQQLSKHADEKPVSFHVPGHRYGEAWKQHGHNHNNGLLEREAADRFGRLLPIDVTELSTTDDLHAPEGVIAEAQRLAAAMYGADETMLLVGGSTAGNIAMILAACEPGDTIIVQRNVHKSVINGLRMAGAKAVFVRPSYEASDGTAIIPRLGDIENALKQYPEAKAVLLSTPNYYGYATSINLYAELAHRHGVPLLVDEAHGAHYGLHEAFPHSALSQGADAVVQSTHKTLPAMTMGAMLHVRRGRIDMERLREMLTMVQSSSPSYPIMASLDIARAMAESAGGLMFESGLAAAERIRGHLYSRAGRLSIGDNRLKEESMIASMPIRQQGERKQQSLPLNNKHEMKVRQDPLRIVIRDRLSLVSGYELQRMLESHGCWAEMADERRVLLIVGPFISDEDTARFIAACEAIEKELNNREQPEQKSESFANIYGEGEELLAVSEPVPFSLHRINRDLIDTLPLQEATGCRSAETVIPYPPGIPLVYAGETITAGIVTELESLSARGAKVQGAANPKLQTIRIIRS
ncbi:aminotransferase class I/II-fold pyridoxal phosphate-dependent enzyme [Paenibacillus kobensis]|uniref:aminotransferase class I/II-fold pyridoxal phosphate-dependent enzyme n=1 Tax=Paenibacillus kobensis TaxID=59841 RepID=UPI000FD7426E|nr:aminotransferase class I/II-fold pyridoxal phosphate-dependent enzyme [Paenibacillus kobensis]